MKIRHGGLVSNPSASKIETFRECTASHVLPQATDQSPQAMRGTDGHKPISDAINAREKLGGVTPGTLAARLVDGINDPVAEPAYVVNVKKRTSRLVGIDIGRNYGELEPYDVPVSLDCQGRRPDGTPWVRDWKFGTYSSEWQLRIQAMAVLFRETETESVVDAGFVYLGEPGEPVHELYTFGRMELDDWADEIVRAFDKVKGIAEALKKGVVPELRQGPWCKYCPAQPTCPAKWSMIKAAMGEMQTLESMTSAMTLEKCGEAWAWVKEISKFAEKAEEALKGRLEQGETFPLPNGKVLSLERRRGWAYPDKKKTLALLGELGATEAQIGEIMTMRADSMVATERKPAG